ncbi:8-amino-7-oxononanoate synthase [Agarivorans sp.]|uniref:8-amino-7-oxononanoate synthase n=1 Tax=Agarivorans sp. TaxID=1872412 RepID=UPI003D051201
MAFEFIQSQLEQRRQQQLFRQRCTQDSAQGRVLVSEGRQYLNFSSNDYLGLARHPKIVEAWREGAKRYGVGCGGSPLVTGFQSPHHDLEQLLCEWQGRPAALLFNSGFSANQGLIKTLLGKNDLLLQDKLNHASLIEAGMLSACPSKRFAHNQLEQLTRRLAERDQQNCLVITEGVFSMDGDQAPIKAMAQLCQQHNSWLMVDDAHGVGCLGEQGRGSLNQQQVNADEVQIQMLTFGKALGVAGASLLCDQELHDYLINFDKSYVYSTAMPAAQAMAISAAIKLVRADHSHQQQLQANIQLFKCLAAELKLPLSQSTTAIQPILIGSSERALVASQQLKQQGFWVTAIRPPTVPPNTARLRITLSSHHQREDIHALLAALASIVGEQHEH